MSKIHATFDGRIVADIEAREVGTSTVYEFPVYINHRRKNKQTGEYEDTGDTSKIRVSVWNERPDVQKGDVVEVVGSLVEKEWQKKDGTTGRQLQTEYVESVTVKYRRDGDRTSANADSAIASIGGKPVDMDAPF